MKAPTIYDVARRAGVSHQTVSRYLHGYEGIRPETRERVQHALEALEYRPNSAARFLKTRRINRIGVLAHRIDQAGPARILAGATAEARTRGYVLDVVTMAGDDPTSIRTALEVIREHQIAGVLATAQTEAVVSTLQAQVSDLPLLVDNSVIGFGDTIPVNERAGRLAAKHLLELGHRRIGYLSGPLTWVASEKRRDGFLAEVEAAGAQVCWMREGDWSAASGEAAWSDLDSSARDVTAIAAGNDSMAIGLISAISADGMDVPGSISVIGTDDMPEARFLLPSLSTVALDFEAEGAYIIDTLLQRIEELEDGRAPSLPMPELRARNSTRQL